MRVTGVQDELLTEAEAYRREIYAHCYRMLGSAHDAEDLVQETYLRAWRAFDRFEGRSSMRTWLYRIATNACLSALESRSRRPMPTGLGAPASDPVGPLALQPEVPWLEPVPDALVDGAGDPAGIVAGREGVRLALMAALQHLPPRQRAVLILRDVLAWRAAEVAEALSLSTVAVNSLLQRARAQLAQAQLSEADAIEPTEPHHRDLLERYARAMEHKDIQAIVALCAEDATWEMPPFTGWYQGAQAIGRLIDHQCPAGPRGMRLLPTAANGQPGFGVYMLEPDGAFHAFQLQVLEYRHGRIGHVAVFFDLSLFALFDLPDVLPSSTPLRPAPAPPTPARP